MFSFTVEKQLGNKLGRAAKYETPHGVIETPAFVTVGTKATVKALTPEQVAGTGTQVVLANTYHLYLEPGEKTIKLGGGLHKFMNWPGPTMTDSGGFQVFSLGAAYGENISKVSKLEKGEVRKEEDHPLPEKSLHEKLSKIDEDGVTFKSVIDGSTHRFTPEKSIEIQHDIGADIIFAFDECTSPKASREYQEEAMERTHRWAARCLEKRRELKVESENLKAEEQALFGIVQGGRFDDLRKKSAKTIGEMNFDGFGIGGSFDKEDIETAILWVNALLPEEKPRHLLGIGEPIDLFGAVENGCDFFDCVAPTRMARNGTLHTKNGRINITNAKFVRDLGKVDDDCECYTCKNYTKSYIAHLFRAEEMLASTLSSIHNVHFIVSLVHKMRQCILNGGFSEFRDDFLGRYYAKR
ncbi:MAG: tRNA guanosine(34) transglycosylase Tgt [bacterium]|nr:tRNA guanosine(34) transglycosylase Tgt [bacterium]